MEFINEEIKYNSTEKIEIELEKCCGEDHKKCKCECDDSSGCEIKNVNIARRITLALISVSGKGQVNLILPPARGKHKILTIRMIKGGREIEKECGCSKVKVRARDEDSINEKYREFEIEKDESIMLRSFEGVWWTIFKTMWEEI